MKRLYSKTKKIIYLLTFVVTLSVAGCRDGKPKPPEQLPDSEIGAYKEALIKIYPYLVLEDSTYRITISKQEAEKLQVPEKYYDRIVEDLDYTNYIIKEEYNNKGIPIELSEPILDTTLNTLLE